MFRRTRRGINHRIYWCAKSSIIMTKLPTITGEELIAALEKAGFSIVRLLVGFYCSGITII